MLKKRKKFCMSEGVEDLIPRVTRAMEGSSIEDQVRVLENSSLASVWRTDWKGAEKAPEDQLSAKR